ncbi:hypothetical protein ERJ75_000484400 [Trypanosoma vivax]|nr:hypothetical protein ERJ75_000484400 [Trypanosoma vivax]
MVKLFVLCTLASCCVFLAPGTAKADEVARENAGAQITCDDSGKQINVSFNLTGAPHRDIFEFGCVGLDAGIVVHLDMTDANRSLEGAKVACYEQEEMKREVEVVCTGSLGQAIQPRTFPTHGCTLVYKSDGPWVNAFVKKNGKVTCLIWNESVKEEFSFAVSGMKDVIHFSPMPSGKDGVVPGTGETGPNPPLNHGQNPKPSQTANNPLTGQQTVAQKQQPGGGLGEGENSASTKTTRETQRDGEQAGQIYSSGKPGQKGGPVSEGLYSSSEAGSYSPKFPLHYPLSFLLLMAVGAQSFA